MNRKKAIELLEQSNVFGDIIGCRKCQQDIKKVIDELQKKPLSITSHIQCPDEECCGCLIEGNILGGVKCNECGKKWGLFPHRTNKFSEKQPLEGEFTKEARGKAKGVKVHYQIGRFEHSLPILHEPHCIIQQMADIVLEACDRLDRQNEFVSKLAPDGDLGYWAEEYLHAYEQLSNMQELQDKFDRQAGDYKDQAVELKEEKHKLQYAIARFEEVQDDKGTLMDDNKNQAAENKRLKSLIRKIKVEYGKMYYVGPGTEVKELLEQALKDRTEKEK